MSEDLVRPAPVEAPAIRPEAPSLGLVVPVLNEEESLRELADAIRQATAASGLVLKHILFVDDGSTDGSWAVIEELSAADPRIEGLRLRRNFGKAAALGVGFERVRGEIVVTMDADLQDDPAELPRFVAKIAEGYDLVSGWKKRRHDPLSKTLPSRLFNAVTRWVSGVPLHDFNCGFKAYRRQVLLGLELYGDLHRYIPALAHAQGHRVGEIEVRHHARKYGHSKYGVGRFLRGFLDLLTVVTLTRYAWRPGHLFGGLGVVLLVLGGAILAYLTGLKIVTGASIGTRPLLLFGALFVIVGIQVLSFGMLSELLIARTSRENRPNLVVSGTRDPQDGT